MSTAERYARDVSSGKIVAGRFVILAAKRFISDLKRKDIYFDEVEANKFVTFAEGCCCLWEDKWRGKPVEIMPWMAFIFQQVFGWYKKADGLRRVRKVYVQVAKKNGKSSIASVLSLFHLFADSRVQTPKVFVGANNEDQAKICVNIAGKIVEQSPDLYEYVDDGEVDLFNYKENIVSIVHNTRDGFIKAMSKETESKTSKQAGGKHGFNPSLGLIDEYAMADSAALLDALESAQAAREEPLMFAITTAGHKKEGPCYAQLRRTGIEILEGIIEDDSYLPFIYEYDPGDDYTDEKIWIKCNPNLGVSVFPAFLRARVVAAKNEGGSKAIDVRTLNFNEWCDTPEVWIPKDVWDLNSHGKKDLPSLTCYGGLEIINGLDLNAFLLYFPNLWKDISAIKCFFWMAADKVVENRMKHDCSQWVKDGYITTTPGNVIDNEDIYRMLLEEISNVNMHSLAFNINLQNHDILQGLIKAGVTCNPISQGYRGMTEPTLAWEELLTAGNIEHFDNPVLSWMNINTMVKRHDNDIKIEKANGRTSGIAAGIHALAQYKTIEALGMKDEILESW